MRRRYAAGIAAAVLLAAGVLAAWSASREPVLTVGVYAGSYWDTPSADCYKILNDAIALFRQAHPGVRVEYVKGITTESYSEWLTERILKGTEPDVYFVLPEDFNLLASTGALAKLEDRMERDADFDAEAYYTSCLRSGVFDGEQYALPQESVPTLMLMNKTLLEDCGLALPDNQWTWDDFYQLCAQVTDVETRRFGVFDYTWLNALTSNGAGLFSEDGKNCFLADERIQDAVRFVKSLNDLNGGYTVTARDFDLGRVAFRPFLFSEYRAYQPYPWRVKKYSGFEWDCVCMPAGPSGGNVSELHTMLVGMSARTKEPELAWELLKLLSMDRRVQNELYTYSHGISPIRESAEDRAALEQLFADIPTAGGFTPEVIRDIMTAASAAPHFERYAQAMVMAENAVAEGMASENVSGQNRQSRMLAAQREINIYLNQ